jgi:uncharacterized protein YqgC (DUF456 family)
MTVHETSPSCGGDCGHCAIGSRPAVEGELAGWRLGLAAAGMFLGPMALAIVGALVGGPEATGQFLGGVTGLVGGAVVAALVSKRLRRFPKENR